MNERAVNWEQLGDDSGIRTAARWLRDRGIWVGLLSADAEAIALGNTSTLDERRPACRFMKVNAGSLSAESVEDPEKKEGHRTCSGSVDRWVSAAVDAGDSPERACIEAECHAGFSARLMPIRHRDSCVGAVYASGFWELDDQVSIERKQQRLESRLAGSQRDVDSDTPTLEGGEIRALEATIRVIARRVETLLGDDGDGESVWHREGTVRFEGMIAASDEMKSLFGDIDTIAPTETPVLITGENGTGKELVARAIHRRSSRSDRPFVPLNCAALSPQLIASELFGHIKGAFSGADRTRKGILETANGGTLLLDEIAEMSPRLQTRLLRFLQEGEFSPVGSNERRRSDVRVIGATNRDLAAQIDAGEFRRDLFYRIGVTRFRVPPLRERRSDIVPIARHFLSEMSRRHGRDCSQFSDGAVDRLTEYGWPGNVRELRNEIERSVIRADNGASITPDALQLGGVSEDGLKGSPMPVPDDMTLPEATDRLERRMIRRALEETGWNKTQAAEQLDVSRRTLIRKVDAFEMSPDDDPDD